MSVFLGWAYKLYDSYKEINPATLTGKAIIVIAKEIVRD
jgi:hypothetical protein